MKDLIELSERGGYVVGFIKSRRQAESVRSNGAAGRG